MNEREYATHYESIPPFEGNFRIGFNSFRRLTTMRPHWHEHIEFVYITEGNGCFVIDGERFAVSRGDLIVANPNTLHALLSDDGIDYHCLLVFPDFFDEGDDPDTVCFQSLVKSDPQIGGLFLELQREYAEDARAAGMMKKALVYRLTAYLVRNYMQADLTPADIKRRTAAISRIRRIEELVAKNYRTKISTRDLAEIFYVSENHFCRLFKKTFGMSFLGYINDYRVGKAELLLSGTGLSITEVATAVGFDSVNYFSRIFKKMRRESPVEYRRRVRGNSSPQ